MGSVLCVTRNGEGGILAQKEGIRIAKDRGDSVTFLFVADSSFLNKLAAPKVVDIKGILENMGRFILCAAVERASDESLSVISLVRHGVLPEVLREIVYEIEPTKIILGHLEGEPSLIDKSEVKHSFNAIKE